MSITVRNTIPVIIVGILGAVILLSFPFDIPVLTNAVSDVSSWSAIITSFALGLGVVNILVIHGRKVSRREKGKWPYSLALIISLVLVLGLGLSAGMTSAIYEYIYDVAIAAGRLSLVSLRGFFMFTAFYRAFRARSWEGTLMLVVVILVMSYQVPLSGMISPIIPDFTLWILDIPSVGGYRAINMIAGIALIIMTFRMLAGMDRTWLGESD